MDAEPQLYAALASMGMTDADLNEGCDLLLACFRPPRAHTSEAAETKHVRDLHALHKWFEAWSEAAKCCIGRPSELLRLGLVVAVKG
jgi:hypothetical protein